MSEEGNGAPPQEEKVELPKESVCPDNECFIEDNVMTIKLYLWGEAAYAKTVGSIELAKDLAKSHFTSIQMRKNLSRNQIIKPSMH